MAKQTTNDDHRDPDRWGRGKKRGGSVGSYSATEAEWNSMQSGKDLSADNARNIDRSDTPSKKSYGSFHYAAKEK